MRRLLTAIAATVLGLSVATAQDGPAGYDDFTTLDIAQSNGVARVTIDNGPINLIDRALMTELALLAPMLARDSSIRVVVFDSANPDFFISRADLGLLERLRTLEGPSTDVSPFHGIVETYKALPQATIAALTGITRGAGSEFVLGLDMRFAAESALLGQPEIGFGLHPGGGGLIRLPQVMGRGRALEIALSGQDYTAEIAADYGWVNRVLPDTELRRFVDDLAQTIASHPAETIARLKAAYHEIEASDHGTALLRDFDHFVEAVQSEAGRNRIAGFQAVDGDIGEIERDLPMVLRALE